MMPTRTEEKPNMWNSHDVLKYGRETLEKYSSFPADELQKIVHEYEHRGLIYTLICERTEKINHDIAKKILEERKH